MRAWLIRTFGGTSAYSAARRVYRHGRVLGTSLWNRRPGACRIRARGHDNRLACRNALTLKKVTVIVDGNHNVIEFSRGARVDTCTFTVAGNDNRIMVGDAVLRGGSFVISGNANQVVIEDECMILHLGIVCEDDENGISIGAGTQVHGSTEMAAIEGTTIQVGSGCLFSGGIHFRTGDSHTITDMAGHRINPSRGICIADRVWVGRNVTMLKGAAIAHSSVVGASAVVTKRFEEPNCAIAGNPARVVRHGVDWRTERISGTRNPLAGDTDDCS